MLFFTILLVMFGQWFAVLGLGNALRKDGEFNKTFYKDWLKVNEEGQELHEGATSGMPGKEYHYLGLWIGTIIWTFRMSIGDNDAIGSCALLSNADNIMFWLCWFMTVMMSCVVFLNFIVAEASNSYAIVTDTLESTIWKEKCSLISEAEDMTWEKYKT